jgi:arginyl-tRNA synthetase
MITRELRHAIARAAVAAGFPAADPGLRATGIPGRYAASVALALGGSPRETAAALARGLEQADWIAAADVTGPGYLTVTVTPAALSDVARVVAGEGSGCVTSDALAGQLVAAPGGDPLAAPGWAAARQAVAARLTARLAAAAGATMFTTRDPERVRLTREPQPLFAGPVSRPRSAGSGPDPGAAAGQTATGVASAVAFAGRDAVLFTLARAIPGKPAEADPVVIARHVPGNPAYAVRYAHARAASGVRWAAARRGDEHDPGPGELTLLDALSWLPERVAGAARRGRPDEFARYLEDLASVTVDVLSSAAHPGKAGAPGSDRLALARAARTGLAAGLGLLEVTAPDRLLAPACPIRWRFPPSGVRRGVRGASPPDD